ncbi:hypothetical protein [Paenibacillus wenxiniae]|uniref:DNA-binding protein n=1 Tax=Paenibacillus wenxiniae TaxID=1636843 RepID=A0ABW4RM04_9BACL
MNHTHSVRDELNTEIARQGYTLSSFSKASGINRGVLSLTLNDQATKSFSMNQLNQMTEALQFPAGWLYERYAQEMLVDIENVSWRRIKDLLTHCLTLEKMELIEMVLDALQDKASYTNYIFSLAEELTEQNVNADLCIFYQYVLDHEVNLQNERFTISQYRLFRANLGLDLQKSFKSTIQFTPYRHALPIHLKLDALAQLINVSFAVKDWDALKQYGEELVTSTILVYNTIIERQHPYIKKSERSLLVYYGKGYIAQAVSLEYKGHYEESKELTTQYEDLSWFKFLDDTDKAQVEKFLIIAKCNRYNLELLQGNASVLKPYIDYLEFFPEEQPASIEIIIKSSNMHKWDIDGILEKYHDIIYPTDALHYLQTTTTYSIISEINRYTNIYYDLALYYFERKDRTDQLEHVLTKLKSHIEQYNRINAFDSSELFEKLCKFYF